MIWTHAICRLCWDLRCLNEGRPGRQPTVLTQPENELCCFCGQQTKDGIYVRHDPQELACVHEKELGMPPQPKRRQACPVCRQNMKWFGDHWVCVNIKVHDRVNKGNMGKVHPFKRRPKRK